MNRIITFIFKPGGSAAKWLLFFAFSIIIALAKYGYINPIIAYLDSDKFIFAILEHKFSLYIILRSIALIILVLWVASIISDAGVKYLKHLRSIKTGNRALTIKIFQILLYFIVFLVLLEIINVELKKFAIFGGAIGIGIGFGLQKITSNFISGLILLFERSVKTGDLVELNDGMYGFIKYIGARYTLVETLDSKEVMLPNEDFITNRVTNWTHSNSQGRIDISIGISYKSDIERARDLILEAAMEHPHCIAEPEPGCYLIEFNDSSVDFELHFWVSDIALSRLVAKSDVMRAIWHKFKENDIQIPFPQRDVHLYQD